MGSWNTFQLSHFRFEITHDAKFHQSAITLNVVINKLQIMIQIFILKYLKNPSAFIFITILQ